LNKTKAKGLGGLEGYDERPGLTYHEVFNVACGDQISLNEMVAMLREIRGKDLQVTYGPERAGDVKHSKASIEKLQKFCGYEPKYRFREGLEIVYEWYQGRTKGNV
jgi:UDP-N-acetylglucosamine 4-epimerase